MSETTKHAPWKFDGQSVLDTQGNSACTKVNGQLIASAPDLLEACNRAVAVLTEAKIVNGKSAVAVSILRDAITKATKTPYEEAWTKAVSEAAQP